MSIFLSFDDAGIAKLVVTGSPSLNEAIEASEALYRDSRFSRPSRILWDLSEGRFSWTQEEVREFGDFVRENRPVGPGRAAVLASDELSFGLSRMYELRSDDIPVEVASFRDAESALTWLNEPF